MEIQVCKPLCVLPGSVRTISDSTHELPTVPVQTVEPTVRQAHTADVAAHHDAVGLGQGDTADGSDCGTPKEPVAAQEQARDLGATRRAMGARGRRMDAQKWPVDTRARRLGAQGSVLAKTRGGPLESRRGNVSQGREEWTVATLTVPQHGTRLWRSESDLASSDSASVSNQHLQASLDGPTPPNFSRSSSDVDEAQPRSRQPWRSEIHLSSTNRSTLSQRHRSQPCLLSSRPDYSGVSSRVAAYIEKRRKQDREHREEQARQRASQSLEPTIPPQETSTDELDCDTLATRLMEERKQRQAREHQLEELQADYYQLAKKYAEAETFIDRMRFRSSSNVSAASSPERASLTQSTDKISLYGDKLTPSDGGLNSSNLSMFLPPPVDPLSSHSAPLLNIAQMRGSLLRRSSDSFSMDRLSHTRRSLFQKAESSDHVPIQSSSSTGVADGQKLEHSCENEHHDFCSKISEREELSDVADLQSPLTPDGLIRTPVQVVINPLSASALASPAQITCDNPTDVDGSVNRRESQLCRSASTISVGSMSEPHTPGSPLRFSDELVTTGVGVSNQEIHMENRNMSGTSDSADTEFAHKTYVPDEDKTDRVFANSTITSPVLVDSNPPVLEVLGTRIAITSRSDILTSSKADELSKLLHDSEDAPAVGSFSSKGFSPNRAHRHRKNGKRKTQQSPRRVKICSSREKQMSGVNNCVETNNDRDTSSGEVATPDSSSSSKAKLQNVLTMLASQVELIQAMVGRRSRNASPSSTPGKDIKYTRRSRSLSRMISLSHNRVSDVSVYDKAQDIDINAHVLHKDLRNNGEYAQGSDQNLCTSKSSSSCCVLPEGARVNNGRDITEETVTKKDVAEGDCSLVHCQTCENESLPESGHINMQHKLSSERLNLSSCDPEADQYLRANCDRVKNSVTPDLLGDTLEQSRDALSTLPHLARLSRCWRRRTRSCSPAPTGAEDVAETSASGGDPDNLVPRLPLADLSGQQWGGGSTESTTPTSSSSSHRTISPRQKVEKWQEQLATAAVASSHSSEPAADEAAAEQPPSSAAAAAASGTSVTPELRRLAGAVRGLQRQMHGFYKMVDRQLSPASTVAGARPRPRYLRGRSGLQLPLLPDKPAPLGAGRARQRPSPRRWDIARPPPARAVSCERAAQTDCPAQSAPAALHSSRSEGSLAFRTSMADGRYAQLEGSRSLQRFLTLQAPPMVNRSYAKTEESLTLQSPVSVRQCAQTERSLSCGASPADGSVCHTRAARAEGSAALHALRAAPYLRAAQPGCAGARAAAPRLTLTAASSDRSCSPHRSSEPCTPVMPRRGEWSTVAGAGARGDISAGTHLDQLAREVNLKSRCILESVMRSTAC